MNVKRKEDFFNPSRSAQYRYNGINVINGAEEWAVENKTERLVYVNSRHMEHLNDSPSILYLCRLHKNTLPQGCSPRLCA